MQSLSAPANRFDTGGAIFALKTEVTASYNATADPATDAATRATELVRYVLLIVYIATVNVKQCPFYSYARFTMCKQHVH
jgi:hypothetical protein